MAKSESTDAPAAGTFEQAMAELEAIVHELEEGQIGLEESLARYEQGVKLLRRCHELLTRAERRIELLGGVNAQGAAVTRPMEEEPSGTLEEKAARRSRRRSAEPSPEPPDRRRSSREAGEPSGGGDDVDETGRLF